MTSDIRYTPSSTHLYGLYDPDGDGITFYKSAAERDEAAEKAIQGYEAFGIWYQGVTGIFAFMVTHCATCINVARPVGETRYEKEGRYEAGEYWPNTDCDYKWNYALKPFPTPEAPNDVINPPVLATHSTPQPPADGELTVNLRMDLSSECLKRLCDGLAAAVKPNGGYRALTTDDDISGEFIGEQQVGVEWWLPEHGCDSLENTLDSIKGRLFAAVRDWLPIAVISTPQPPADGEVAASELVDLAHELRKASEYLRAGCGWNKAVEAIERAIELIEGGVLQRLAPVAVSERLPGAEDCIKRGNDHWCWGQERSLLTGQASARWRLMRVSALTDEAVNWLFASALPTPTTEAQP